MDEESQVRQCIRWWNGLKLVLKKIILINKKESETPLEALEVFRLKNKDYKDAKMTYAGRLDPMASGLLLILAGDKVKEKDKYLALDKDYEFEVLFGVATDTHDILGKVTDLKFAQTLDPEQITEKIHLFQGKISQKVPLYSTKTWNRARKGEVLEREERFVEVKKLYFSGLRKIKADTLLNKIQNRINKVEGDFRQKEILDTWQKSLKNSNHVFYIGSFRVKCSTGTYVRSIASDLGIRLGVPALAYSIKRIQIGKWRLKE